MTTLDYFVVDAFTRRPFWGNPAAVVPLERFLPDDVLQAIAREANLSETAFFAPEGDGLRLRWFTPTVEVDLCGHATLASAHVLMREIDRSRQRVAFSTRSGVLTVETAGDLLRMDFPSRPPSPIEIDERIVAALGARPVEMLKARDVVALFEDAAQVRALAPDLASLGRMRDVYALCVTAKGGGADGDVDFVSRFFAPGGGVDEDPVTGSAHCTLTPFWASRLGKSRLSARQVGPRGGDLTCELSANRVALEGHAVTVVRGRLQLPG